MAKSKGTCVELKIPGLRSRIWSSQLFRWSSNYSVPLYVLTTIIEIYRPIIEIYRQSKVYIEMSNFCVFTYPCLSEHYSLTFEKNLAMWIVRIELTHLLRQGTKACICVRMSVQIMWNERRRACSHYWRTWWLINTLIS